jgi:hypothetical protein
MDEKSSGPGSLVDVPKTEVSAILNNGTSQSSSLLGVQTVFEDARRGGSPMEGSDATTLFPESILITGQPKKYSIHRMPTDVQEFMSVCRSRIGRGRIFCLIPKCSINHQSSILTVKPGNLVVTKLLGKVAFESPRVSSDALDDAVLGGWITTQETLTSWTNKFGQAKEAVEAGVMVDLKALESKMEEELKAASFKTPRAKRGLLSSKTTPLGIGISPYTKILSGEESFSDITEERAREKLQDVILSLDAGLEEISAYSVMLGQDVEKMINASATNFQMLESKLLIASRLVGDRSESLASDLDSPTVWGPQTVGESKSPGALVAMNQRLEEVRAEANCYVNSAPPRVDPLLAVRVGKVEDDLLATITHISQAFNGLETRLDENISVATPAPTPTAKTLQNSFMVDLQKRVNKMSGEIQNLRSDRKATSIKFAGLGFNSLQQASAWLEANIPTIHADLIVDPHTVFEHIYAEEKGDDFFKKFERVHKLQILMPQQGYAMTSFQQAMPKSFYSAGTRVVRDHASFFNKIPTWAEWDHQYTGFRDSLRAGLAAFASSHREAIALDTTFGEDPTAIAYAVAILSLNESVSIIEAWISFIELC